MQLRVENWSGYDTEDLGAFFIRGLRATRTRVDDLRITVVAAPQRSRGRAEIGGREMTIAMNAPWYCRRTDCERRLARMFMHECAHIQGLEHGDMPRDLLLSYGPRPSWAEGSRIRYVGRAPNQMEILRKDVGERRYR